jgi:hypothetical protein
MDGASHLHIEKLAPVQYEIISELSIAIDRLGAGAGLQSVLGSWGDTLPQADILQMLKDYNALTSKSI